MTDTSPSAAGAEPQEDPGLDNRPVPTAQRLTAALAPGRSYHERQRELVHASLITRWVPKHAKSSPRA